MQCVKHEQQLAHWQMLLLARKLVMKRFPRTISLTANGLSRPVRIFAEGTSITTMAQYFFRHTLLSTSTAFTKVFLFVTYLIPSLTEESQIIWLRWPRSTNNRFSSEKTASMWASRGRLDCRSSKRWQLHKLLELNPEHKNISNEHKVFYRSIKAARLEWYETLISISESIDRFTVRTQSIHTENTYSRQSNTSVLQLQDRNGSEQWRLAVSRVHTVKSHATL